MLSNTSQYSNLYQSMPGKHETGIRITESDVTSFTLYAGIMVNLLDCCTEHIYKMLFLPADTSHEKTSWCIKMNRVWQISIFQQVDGCGDRILHRYILHHVRLRWCCLANLWWSHLLYNLFSLHVHSCAKSIHALQGPFSCCLCCHSLSIPLTLRPWQLLDFQQQLICQPPPVRHLLMLPISISC